MGQARGVGLIEKPRPSRSRTLSSAAPSGSETSLAKALQVIRAFVDGQERWGVREIAVAVGLPRSTVHRLLLGLRADGFLEYDEVQRKYRVGFEFMRLASAVYVRHGPRESALPIMRELVDRCGESVWLALYGGARHRIAYVAEQGSSHTLRHHAPIGREETLVEGACGLAVLAALPAAEQKAARVATQARAPADLEALWCANTRGVRMSSRYHGD